jgi:hypothetical protein
MRSWDRPLLACVLLSGALGTIHSFSLFIEPFEADLGAGRGGVASVYSVALVTLTVVVLVGHPLFRRVPGPMVALLATGGAAVGLLLAASASSLVGLLIGYGIVFGGCNGLGYAFSLQRAAEANPDRRGLALGLVTAAYALGGGGAAFLLGSRIDTSGAASAMRSLAMAIAITGLIVAALLTNGPPSPATGAVAHLTGADRRLLLRFWASYGLAVVAGLMALGHAAAIVDAAGGPGGATVAVAGLASASGGVWIALTADRTGTTRLLRYLPLGSALVLGIAAANSNGVIAASAVTTVAFAYGAVIAIYPFAVARTFGGDQYPAAYGRVFTAWGTAGLVGPFGAGLLFEATGTYRVPLMLAAAAAIGSTITAPRLAIERNRAV